MTKMTCDTMDPRELVKDLADRIGLDNLMAAAIDLQGEPEPNELDHLRQLNAELGKHAEILEKRNAMLEGKIDALKFALRCNGISGADVR